MNTRNFGPIRSPYHAYFQSKGDAIVSIAADLQDPPYLIKEFIKKWEEGYKVIVGVKTQSKENPFVFLLRKVYYNIVSKLSEVKLIKNFTGYGLYDRKVMDILKTFNEPYPYFRGLISEVGFDVFEIEYVQQKRKNGTTGSSVYLLLDVAILGVVSHSKIPLRLATVSGAILSVLSFIAAILYAICKLLLWQDYVLGIASIAIGLFFFSAVQLLFVGIIGEYLGSIYTRVLDRPLVIERERINF